MTITEIINFAIDDAQYKYGSDKIKCITLDIHTLTTFKSEIMPKELIDNPNISYELQRYKGLNIDVTSVYGFNVTVS